MKLDELFRYKNTLMRDILNDQDVVNLLTDNEELRKDPTGLAYTQVHPYEYIPETVEHGYSYICFDVDIQKNLSNGLFYIPYLYIWVMCHRSRLRLPEGGVRTDAICAKLCDDLDGSWEYSLGKFDLYSSKRFAPVMDYNGKVLTFVGTDVKRTNPNTKQIPTNRMKGL